VALLAKKRQIWHLCELSQAGFFIFFEHIGTVRKKSHYVVLNEETRIIGHKLRKTSDDKASSVHPAFNISGVELEFAENAGRYIITIHFLYNERYAGFIIPDGSEAIPD